LYYREAHGALILFDLTSRESFEAVQFWMNKLEKMSSDNISKILVGNKSDLKHERVVTTEEG
jgi:GTPase SAR1 family protein